MKFPFFIILLSIIISCNQHAPEVIPEISKTGYDKFKGRNFALNFGDIVQIVNTQYRGIICDVSEDEGGLWYGILFMDGSENLFGRSIPNAGTGDCINLFDLIYLSDKGLNSVIKLSRINLDFNKIGIGAKSTATNERDLIRDYLSGIKKRKTNETPCKMKTQKFEPVNENYRGLSEIRL